MVAINYGITDPRGTILISNFDIEPGLPANITVKEINIVESLLNPGLQVMTTLQSDIYRPVGKNFDSFKNQVMSFSLVGTEGYAGKTLTVNQTVFRLDNRNRVQNNFSAVEEMTFYAIDDTVIEDAKCLVSKSWKCTPPSDVVRHVLDSCLKAKDSKVETADPSRDYIAENLHPFQVISQQANVALADGDPSFLHFMTLDENTGRGVHHFESLKKLTEQDSNQFQYVFAEPTKTHDYGNKTAVINFSFPCDFDYMSDLLNGIDENGENQNSMGVVDPVLKVFTKMLGGGGQQACDCGIGQYNFKVAQSNKQSADQRNSCNLDVETHLLKRQARMGLLEKDKIALRITVPWNPQLHAGKVISFQWSNKEGGPAVYGTGEYLIVSMMHSIRMGGYATTTMDCVSKTVGQGIV